MVLLRVLLVLLSLGACLEAAGSASGGGLRLPESSPTIPPRRPAQEETETPRSSPPSSAGRKSLRAFLTDRLLGDGVKKVEDWPRWHAGVLRPFLHEVLKSVPGSPAHRLGLRAFLEYHVRGPKEEVWDVWHAGRLTPFLHESNAEVVIARDLPPLLEERWENLLTGEDQWDRRDVGDEKSKDAFSPRDSGGGEELVLGLAIERHDAAIAATLGGRVLGVVEFERLFREKHFDVGVVEEKLLISTFSP